MNYKEKAEELVEKFFSVIPVPDYDEYVNPLKTHKERAKQCALICVDEIIGSVKYTFPSAEFLNYWQQVKTEIEKL
jgi:hypothetical protein